MTEDVRAFASAERLLNAVAGDLDTLRDDRTAGDQAAFGRTDVGRGSGRPISDPSLTPGLGPSAIPAPSPGPA
jgi:hypothetical protein